MPFTVATWNLQWKFGNWRERQSAIDSTLVALNSDIVLVQECWPSQVERVGERLGFSHVWGGRSRTDEDGSDRSFGNAVLSRWPIRDSSERFLADEAGREYRCIVGANIDSPWGVLSAFTTHLEHRFDQSSTRTAQLTQASEFIETKRSKSLPPVFGGDLNATPDSDEIRKLTGRSVPYVKGRIWTDAWEQVGTGPGYSWADSNPYTQRSAWPNRRLDYVLVGWPRESRPIGNPVRTWLFGQEPVHGVVGSDHFGVAVEVRTSG